MVLGLEIEFWFKDHEGNRLTHPRATETTPETIVSDREESEQRQLIRREEEDRLVRQQERRNLREQYRLRFEEERQRYRQPRVRSSQRPVPREEEYVAEREKEEAEITYDEKMPRGQRYEAVSSFIALVSIIDSSLPFSLSITNPSPLLPSQRHD